MLSNTFYTSQCLTINQFFDTIKVNFITADTEGQNDTTSMLTDYTTCLNTPGQTEQFCAARDKSLEENNYLSASCPDSVIPDYENEAWVSGNCSDGK